MPNCKSQNRWKKLHNCKVKFGRSFVKCTISTVFVVFSKYSESVFHPFSPSCHLVPRRNNPLCLRLPETSNRHNFRPAIPPNKHSLKKPIRTNHNQTITFISGTPGTQPKLGEAVLSKNLCLKLSTIFEDA